MGRSQFRDRRAASREHIQHRAHRTGETREHDLSQHRLRLRQRRSPEADRRRQERQEVTMMKPTVHLNGTSRSELRDGFIAAYEAIGVALIAMQYAYPNGRDYYPQGHGAIIAAMDEHRARVEALQKVRQELDELARHVDA